MAHRITSEPFIKLLKHRFGQKTASTGLADARRLAKR